MTSSGASLSNGIVSTPSLPSEVKAKDSGTASSALKFSATILKVAKNSSDAALDACQEPQKMAFVAECCGIASQICDRVGGNAAEAVPFLGMAVAPLYFFHAMKNTVQRFKFMVTAAKTNQAGVSIYYAARAIDATGNAIGNFSKCLSGGFKIAGIGAIPGSGILITLVLPILLIIAGTIGAVAQAGALWRNTHALKRFNAQALKKEKTLNEFFDHLKFLQGPSKCKCQKSQEDPLVYAKAKLDAQSHEEMHFTRDARRKELKTQINAFLEKNSEDSLKLQFNELLDSVTKGLQHFETENSELPQNLSLWLSNLVQEFEKINKESNTIVAFRSLVKIYEDLATLNKMANLSEPHKKAWDDLEQVCKKNANGLKDFLCEGDLLLGLSQSEMHRVVLYNMICILISAMVLTSGILYLASPHLKTEAFAISMASSGATLACFIFDRCVSQKKFYAIDPLLSFPTHKLET